MRIIELSLERYGHISGERLDFAPGCGLHVVTGANEAGKSTALEALSDALFGFNRDSRKYQHPDDPRITVTLQAADGTQASFTRRRKRKDSLLDGAGAPLPEAALARFLGSTTRNDFRKIFGLDGERLREGGRTILTEQGDATATVLQAHGLTGLRDAVDRLDKEAAGLFGNRRTDRRIRLAAERYRKNRDEIAGRSLSATGYQDTLRDEAAASDRLAAIQMEITRLGTTRAQLERIRRTIPVRTKITAATADLATLGAVPNMPPGAAERRFAALEALRQAAQGLDAGQRRLVAIQAKINAIIPDPAALAEAGAITALAAEQSAMAREASTHQDAAAEAAAHRQLLDNTAARLGIPERGDALLARLPDAATRRIAERLLKQQTAWLGQHTQAASSARDHGTALDRAGRAAASLTPAAPTEALQAAMDAAGRAGPLDASLAEAAAALAAAEAGLAAASAALPLWDGNLARLQNSPVPLESEALRLAEALAKAETAHDTAKAGLAAHHEALAECRAGIAGMKHAGALPTAQAVTEARTRRDAAWATLRQHVLEGKANPQEPINTLDRLIREADGLADRRISDAARVARWEDLRIEEGRLLALHDGLATAAASAGASLDAAQAGWRQAWAPAAINPLPPAAMRDWTRARDSVLKAARTRDDAKRREAAIAGQRQSLIGALQAALPGAAPADLAGLHQLAGRRLKAADAAAAAWDKAQDELNRAQAQRDESQTRLEAIKAEAKPWAAAWEPIAAQLGLFPTAAEDAADTLLLWTEAQGHGERWQDAERRAQQSRTRLDHDEAARRAMASRLAIPFTADLLPTLARRLQAAQAGQAEQARLQADANDLTQSATQHRQDAEAAESQLATLRQWAGAANDEALASAIQRAAEHGRLTALLHEYRAELQTLAEGKTEAELANEAASTPMDGIGEQISAIDHEQSRLGREREEVAARRAGLSAARHTMEQGQDVTGPAQDMQDALTDIEQSSQHYIRLRLAHALLQAGIERFRRSRQAPLLTEASGLFAALTEGRYNRLEQDEDSGEPIIVAARPDGSTCPAEHLSEGTRDQLFLALRLASIRLGHASAEPMPFIADDLLVNFDDSRALAALRVLAQLGETSQVILFTHHDHLASLANRVGAALHQLPDRRPIPHANRANAFVSVT